ncbi:flagellar protein FliT [Bacillus sp. CECT 9360]|uniref:flagellar protein FliT n=1 Tax=Bacillus sp. CECT 9360 TaxID=2845821 RepID=UPI001E457470|nr:flagellar protein FliT [Bacillus sp. CECT 9360]CAH0344845.1 Flagellar protein FliT [Bacillus sp. CECT 9360]
MNRLQAYYESTSILINLAESIQQADDRDEGVGVIETMLDERQVLLKDFNQPYTEAEVELGRKLIAMEKSLNEKLLLVKQKIGLDLKEIKQKKENHKKYANPYQPLSTDGMFYDKKN